GFGYIAPGARLEGAPGAVFRVRSFHEKPTRSFAARIIRRGGLWNSFVMVGRVRRFIDLLTAVLPDEVERLAALPVDTGGPSSARPFRGLRAPDTPGPRRPSSAPLGTGLLPAGPDALAAAYETMAPWNFSRDFLQHVARHLVVTRGERLGWSDWGTPEAI